jgi:hypothetical protein
MRTHLRDSRSPLACTFHSAPKLSSAVFSNPNFISMGEWVEVNGDRTPGYNPEGGIGVVIHVQDNCADVKYVPHL